MYKACRHIKSNGLRCKSRALCDGNFCYFHSKLHVGSANSKPETLRLPPAEDLSSILLSLSRISDALIDSRIDTKRAAQLIWIQQIAMQAVLRRDSHNADSVHVIMQSEQGDELAPELTVCAPGEECENCPSAATCPKSVHNPEPDEDEDDDDDEDDAEDDDDAGDGDDDDDEDDAEDEEADEDDSADEGDDEDEDTDEDEEDDDDEDEDFAAESAKELVASLKYLDSIRRQAGLGP